MWVFEKLFELPAGHTLWQVEPPEGGARIRWEHEEYDGKGNLVAVYESRLRDDRTIAFVKFSPNGWVLSVSGRSPLLPPRKAPGGRVVASLPAVPVPDLRQ